jgi:hypothetical protein
VVGLEPVVGVEQADGVVFLADRDQRADAARRVAEVAVVAIELEMAHARFVEPGLRKAVGDENVIRSDRLLANAGDATFEQRPIFSIVGCDDCVTRAAIHRVSFVCARHDSAAMGGTEITFLRTSAAAFLSKTPRLSSKCFRL